MTDSTHSRQADPPRGAMATKGDNVPPSEAEIQQDLLNEKTRDLDKRLDELTAAAGRVPDIEDADTAVNVATLMGQINACAKDFETMRKAEKEPLDKRVAVVQGHFSDRKTRIKKAKGYVTPKQTAWQVKVEAKAKQEREEAARAAAAATTTEEVAAATEKVRAAKSAGRTRDDYGQTASLRTTWKYKIVDIRKVPAGYLELAKGAVRAAINAGVRDIPGLRIYDEKGTVTRSQTKAAE